MGRWKSKQKGESVEDSKSSKRVKDSSIETLPPSVNNMQADEAAIRLTLL